MLLEVVDRELAESRLDGPLDVTLVHPLGGEVQVRDLEHPVQQFAECRLGSRYTACGHRRPHPVPGGLGFLHGGNLLIQVAVTLCYRIQADRDRLLVAGTVRADVPSRFPHGSEGRSIGSFIGTGGGDYLRKAP
jgi:hypothetical protein